ncbi:DEAD/DEAH box helicase, partial [Candidatus Shikimatogenerans silvanidophilus]|uniref:preprotein translocase subunit SecA n=1 Tax=Candidatus Shikimatogenerans silvanidophilus TaxID=2782547 RepID=UPI001BA81E1E
MFFLKILKKLLKNNNYKKVLNFKKIKKIKEKLLLFSSLSNDDLRNKTFFFKKKIQNFLKNEIKKIKILKKKIKNTHNTDIKKNIYTDINTIKKTIYKKEQEILNNLLTEAFAIIIETTKRFYSKDFITVNCTEYDIFFSETKPYIKINYKKNIAIWKTTWEVYGIPIKWNMIPYDVQLIGGIVLHEGNIAEMATGEGKTLVSILPIYLNSLTGRGVHIVTVNDFLSKRDKEWMSPILEFHGITVDCINQYNPYSIERKNAYNADVTYGTNSEFCFDYLRDNMVNSKNEIVQKELNYAIIDEVDSVLIDEARTPLILSGKTGKIKKNNKKKLIFLNKKIEKLIKLQIKYINNKFIEIEKKIKKFKIEIYKDKKKEEYIGLKLLEIFYGYPKYKPLNKLLLKKYFRNILKNSESIYLRNKNLGLTIIKFNLYFIIDEVNKNVDLTEKGIHFLNKELKNSEFYKNFYKNYEINNVNFFVLPNILKEINKIEKNISNIDKKKKIKEILSFFIETTENINFINKLLKAYILFEKNIDYIIIDKKVKIIDEQTGRILEDRRYSDGLHQAIEAKENVEIQPYTKTLATITLQNYFRMYKKISGMTGTAKTESSEFLKIYNLNVITIPTNKPVIRKDYKDIFFKTKKDKYNKIIQDIIFLSKIKKRPVLVGTTSVEVSELISKMLKNKGINHNVLNAKFHKEESKIISSAGKIGVVTIATNMAGRGTDIKISNEVKKLGGLAIIGTERHESRRIDLQLKGRSGRQGDPGTSQFYISLEDNLIRLFFGSDKIIKLLENFIFKEVYNIQHPLITKYIESAQKKIEENNFSTRKFLLQYDNIMNKHREIIYTKRRNALFEKKLYIDINNMILYIIKYFYYDFLKKKKSLQKLEEKFKNFFGLNNKISIFNEINYDNENHKKNIKKIYFFLQKVYKKKSKELNTQIYNIIKKKYLISSIPITIKFTNKNKKIFNKKKFFNFKPVKKTIQKNKNNLISSIFK